MTMKCLIVGGGIGGLCLAIGLRDIGVEVDLIEAKEVWTVYGVGIIQQCNVVRAMHQLGLLDRYLSSSFPFDDLAMYDADCKLKARFTPPRLAGEQYPSNIGISRLALHKMLVDEAERRQTNVHIGCKVQSLSQTADHVEVTFDDGSSGTYDLVVGADGAHSQIRRFVLGSDTKPTLTGQSVWRHNFPRDTDLDHLAVFYGPNGNAGLVPLGPDLMYLFLTTTEPAGARFESEDLPSKMRERLADFGGRLSELTEQITDPQEVVFRPMETFVTPEWNNGRVLLIGDAAHTTTPHLAQGAGMAIEDAVVLRDELSIPRPIEEQIQSFLKRRVERCRFATELSAQVGQWEMEKSHYPERMAALQQIVGYMAQPI